MTRTERSPWPAAGVGFGRHTNLPLFDGRTYEPQHDVERMTGQLARVRELMADGCWRTLGEIAVEVGGSEAGCSARLRDCRKARWGGHTVERRRRGNPKAGLHEYRLILRVGQA